MRGLDNTPQLTPGVKLGQYTLRELLGRGGTGEVWSVYSSSDQQEYALKFLRLELAADISRREAFRKEANLALRLRSPQLLRVLRYDVTPAERPFIVMELLHGEDLDALLSREGQLPIREALLVAIELLKALSELHALDLVHRDLKPSNVFLLRARGANGEPRAKLIDFGHLTVSAHQPTPSALEGTYLYMAPEQLLRRPVSAATDLYSVGALLFTMISGRPPFIITGGDKPYAHLERPAPALTDRVPQAPRALSRLLALCLDADPARRPESADALRRTLERTLDELARPAPADDGLLPAEDEAPPPPAAWSDPEAQERQEALTLEALLRGQHEELAEAWTQAITERPTFNRLQPHLLKQSAKSYLGLLAQVAGGRPTQLLAPLAERLAQSPSHLSVEFAPLLNAALLRAAARACAPYEWSEQALQDAQSALAGLLYALQQRVIDAIVTRHPADAEALLKRVFAHGAEFMAISTLSGVLLHTQPGLRSVFGEVDDSHLRQRGLFELLNGYQPILPLQRAFRELPQTPLTGPFVLSNPKARGLATQLKLSPHLFERHGQTLVLLFFEALEERSQHDEPGAPGEAGGADDLDAPQSLPWVETREISALSPVEQRQLFGFVPGEMFGEDEPTPMPSEGRLRAPEDDFAPPPSLSRAPAP
ncbi:MAG: serine/threonine protein kinase, partial [Deltaproteobacteria bacterium]|nr:serine/threonine protein kinase [Deltaproteobacteria bacterium]